ncbi:unnamed protein product, partial [Ectocarpus sp. 8 AP-2014]
RPRYLGVSAAHGRRQCAHGEHGRAGVGRQPLRSRFGRGESSPCLHDERTHMENLAAHFKKLGKTPPPIVAKDVIVHPMQMAQAL